MWGQPLRRGIRLVRYKYLYVSLVLLCVPFPLARSWMGWGGGIPRDTVTWWLLASMNLKCIWAVSVFAHWDLSAASLWPRSSVSCHRDEEWQIFCPQLSQHAPSLNVLPLSLQIYFIQNTDCIQSTCDLNMQCCILQLAKIKLRFLKVCFMKFKLFRCTAHVEMHMPFMWLDEYLSSLVFLIYRDGCFNIGPDVCFVFICLQAADVIGRWSLKHWRIRTMVEGHLIFFWERPCMKTQAAVQPESREGRGEEGKQQREVNSREKSELTTSLESLSGS